MTNPKPAPAAPFYAEDLPHRTKLFILASVMLGLFLSALDQTIVSTAMPAIIAELRGLEYVAWTSTSYLLASTTMVPIYGKLSDIYGRRVILLSGIVIFLVGSILCGISQDIFQLIGYRVIQGIGAAALTSTAFAIPADLFSPAERPKYMGLFGAVFGVSSIIGPFLGGYLTDAISWRWVFFVNLPVGLIAFLFILRSMPTLRRGGEAVIDWAGSVSLVFSVVPLLLALTLDKEIHAWSSPLIVGLFILATIGTAVFLYVETKAVAPIINLSLFKGKLFSVTMFTSFLNGAAFFGAFLFISLFMVNSLGVSATEAGSAQIPLMLSFVVGSIVASQLVARTGRYKPFILIGFSIMLIGFYSMTQLTVDMQTGDVVWRMLLLGMGLGPVMPLLNLAMQNAIPYALVGTAVANRQFFQQLGQAVGAAVFGVILTTTLTQQITVELKPIMAQLPAEMQQRMSIDNRSIRNAIGTEQAGEVSPIRTIESDITNAHQERIQLLTNMVNGDTVARDTLLNNATTPQSLKDAINTQTVTPATIDSWIALLEQQRSTLTRQLETIDQQIKPALQRAFATSIRQIYQDAIWLVALSFILVVIFLPEIPLRKSNRDIPNTVE
ncbi:MAG: MDR family MFS transporter [Roseiflexaceae bacterium]